MEYFVDATNGEDRVDAQTFRTLAFALGKSSPIGPGDALVLRGRVPAEGVVVKKRGTAASPIRIVGEEGATLTGTIDALSDAAGWRHHEGDVFVFGEEVTVPEAFVAKPNAKFSGFCTVDAPSGRETFQLIAYKSYEALAATEERFAKRTQYYAGPGLYYDGAERRLYLRLRDPDPDVVGVENTLFGDRRLLSPADVALAIGYRGPSAAGVILRGDEEGPPAHLVFERFAIENLATPAFKLSRRKPAVGITFRDLQFVTGGIALHVSGASEVEIERVNYTSCLPRWAAFGDLKSGASGVSSVGGRAFNITNGAHHVTIRDCRVVRAMDAMLIAGRANATRRGEEIGLHVHHVRVLGCHFESLRDDIVHLGTDAYEIEFAWNTSRKLAYGVSYQGSGEPPHGLRGRVFIHHNVFHCVPIFCGRGRVSRGVKYVTRKALAMSHNDVCFGDNPRKIYHNTLVIETCRESDGARVPVERVQPFHLPPYLGPCRDIPIEPGDFPRLAQEMFNNIVVIEGDHKVVQQVRAHLGREVLDGNLYWRDAAEPTGILMRVSFVNRRGIEKPKAFHSLSAFQASRRPLAQTKELYPPGWEASGVEADPMLDAQYRPRADGPAASGAVDLSDRDWPGLSGEQHRGALAPRTLGLSDGDAYEATASSSRPVRK